MLATWDDHDFGWDNVGGDYPCRAGSQAEFAAHFTVPEWEPLHPAGGQAGPDHPTIMNHCKGEVGGV